MQVHHACGSKSTFNQSQTTNLIEVIQVFYEILLGLRKWLKVEQKAILMEHPSLEWIRHGNPTSKKFKLPVDKFDLLFLILYSVVSFPFLELNIF